MTDEQIYATIDHIMRQLHHPTTGFHALRNEWHLSAFLDKKKQEWKSNPQKQDLLKKLNEFIDSYNNNPNKKHLIIELNNSTGLVKGLLIDELEIIQKEWKQDPQKSGLCATLDEFIKYTENPNMKFSFLNFGEALNKFIEQKHGGKKQSNLDEFKNVITQELQTKKENFTKSIAIELEDKRKQKLNEIAKKYDLDNVTEDIQRFRLTGQDIVDNHINFSCDNAAKAFYYLNSQLKNPLDIVFLISTVKNRLIDGRHGHVLPVVKFPDGTLRAIEPQLPPDEKYILKDTIQVGGDIQHLLGDFYDEDGKGKPAKILEIMSPKDYLPVSYNEFMRHAVEHDKKTQATLDVIRDVLKYDIPNIHRKARRQLLKEFCVAIQDKGLPIKILKYIDDKKQTYDSLGITIWGELWKLSIDNGALKLIEPKDKKIDEMSIDKYLKDKTADFNNGQRKLKDMQDSPNSVKPNPMAIMQQMTNNQND